jgi:hypothetical protein
VHRIEETFAEMNLSYRNKDLLLEGIYNVVSTFIKRKYGVEFLI